MANLTKPRRWEKISARKIFHCPYLDLYQDRVRNLLGEKTYYYYLKTKPFVAIVPRDQSGHLYLVRQYRYTLHRFTWEVPMGTKQQKESYQQAAQRELFEEASLKAKSWLHLGSNYLTGTLLPNRFHIYLAQGLKPLKKLPDPAEIDAVQKFSLPAVRKMIQKQEIVGAATLASLFTYYLKKIV